MPVELLMRPVMRPLVVAKAVLFHPHRRASRYVANIVEFDESKLTEYAIRKRFGTGSKVYDVYSTEEGTNGPSDSEQRLYWFVRSRAVKGAYKMYSPKILGTGLNGEDEPIATTRAGLRSNVLMIRSPDQIPAAELGWHIINHRVDAIDSYRVFTLANGKQYHWTTIGKFLEIVHNPGEKESEVRERIGQVIPAGPGGWNIKIDESKISRELAITTALSSVIDQWNTNIAIGGIYYARQQEDVRWKRD